MESSIFPVPSEIVIPPAAFLAAQGSLMSGEWGSPVRSVRTGFGYDLLGVPLIGRPSIVKWGRFVIATPKKLEQAEQWLRRYEAGGIFFARLLPVVRHLISIPAGIVRMNFTFSV